MDIQRFFLPEERKLVLSTTLLLLSFAFAVSPYQSSSGFTNFGFPLPAFTLYYGWFSLGDQFEVLAQNLVINACFWYLFACLVAMLYDTKVMPQPVPYTPQQYAQYQNYRYGNPPRY